MKARIPAPAWLFLAFALSGCARGLADARPTARHIETPAAAGSGQPNLAIAPDGRVLLSWVEPAGEGIHRLRFSARVRGGSWSEPQTIAEGRSFFVNWADFPSLAALPDGTLFAHWLAKSGPGTYAYDVRVAVSGDGGKTWGQPVVPHRDATQTEHGFVSMAPWDSRTMGLVWLDGRKTAGGTHAGHGEMALVHGTIDADGRLGPEAILDGRVCDCCQTDAARSQGATVVAYRDRTDKEVRDISVVRFADGRWSEPRVLSRDEWQIDGCPVNGPAIAAAGPRVAVAWFTAARAEPRVSVAFSSDSGATFGAPIAVDDGLPLGRVDVVLFENGASLVSWLGRSRHGAELRVRRVHPDGTRSEPLVVADSSAARSSGFPRMVESGGEVVLAWRDAAEPANVRTAVVDEARFLR